MEALHYTPVRCSIPATEEAQALTVVALVVKIEWQVADGDKYA